MRRSATLVSIAAVSSYFIAVAERSSLGVAALEASQRFDVTAAQLSSLTVMQLMVYAAMQIPVGVLLDRYGSRMLIVAGALLMAVGQVLVANSEVLAQAVIGRA
ncbi:MAG: MFS transporter, partial [Micrococcales bacterium]